jgi:hypothetical protein
LTAIGRFNFDLGSLPSFGQVALSYTDKAWNKLEVDERVEMDSYTVLNLSAGIEKNNWALTLYVNNVSDERGQIDEWEEFYVSMLEPPTVFSGLDHRASIIRPRSFGIRWAQRF